MFVFFSLHSFTVNKLADTIVFSFYLLENSNTIAFDDDSPSTFWDDFQRFHHFYILQYKPSRKKNETYRKTHSNRTLTIKIDCKRKKTRFLPLITSKNQFERFRWDRLSLFVTLIILTLDRFEYTKKSSSSSSSNSSMYFMNIVSRRALSARQKIKTRTRSHTHIYTITNNKRKSRNSRSEANEQYMATRAAPPAMYARRKIEWNILHNSE